MDDLNRLTVTLRTQLAARRWHARRWRRPGRADTVLAGSGDALRKRLAVLVRQRFATGPIPLRVGALSLPLLRRPRAPHASAYHVHGPSLSLTLSPRLALTVIRSGLARFLESAASSGKRTPPVTERPTEGRTTPAATGPRFSLPAPLRWGRPVLGILRETIRDWVRRERLIVTRARSRPRGSPLPAPRPARSQGQSLGPGTPRPSAATRSSAIPSGIVTRFERGSPPSTRPTDGPAPAAERTVAALGTRPSMAVWMPALAIRTFATVTRHSVFGRASSSEVTDAGWPPAFGRAPSFVPAGGLVTGTPLRGQGPRGSDADRRRLTPPPPPSMPLATRPRPDGHTVHTEELRRELTTKVMEHVHTVVEKEVRGRLHFDSRDARRLKEQMYSELGSQIVFERERLGR